MFLIVAAFARLLAAMVAGLQGRWMGDRAVQGASILCMLVSAARRAAAWVRLECGKAQSGSTSLDPWIRARTFHAMSGAPRFLQGGRDDTMAEPGDYQ
jgi:hypothetical protein